MGNGAVGAAQWSSGAKGGEAFLFPRRLGRSHEAGFSRGPHPIFSGPLNLLGRSSCLLGFYKAWEERCLICTRLTFDQGKPDRAGGRMQGAGGLGLTKVVSAL